MTEPSSTSEGVPSVGQEVANLPVVLPASISSSKAGKRSAAEVFEGDSIETLKDKETTLDDVLAPRLTKKSKLLDEELPDVDDNEEFPPQTEEMDEDLALGTMDAESRIIAKKSRNVGKRDLELDMDELAPSEEGEDEEAEDSDVSTSQNNDIDIVDVEEDEAEDYGQSSGQDEDREDDEAQETAWALARARNQKEARQLVVQLDDSARSKLCLTAMEKYGEELFYGHEDARDAILVDACAQDAVLSLMRDAIRVKDLYERGSSAAAPLEVDEDEEDREGDNEVGGYEDEEEDADEEEEEKSTDFMEDHDGEVVVISEEEEGNGADSRALNSTMFSPGSEVHPSGATDVKVSGANGEDVDVGLERLPHSAGEIGCDTDPNDGYGSGHSEQETTEGEALGNVGAAGDLASGFPIDDEGSLLPVQAAVPET